MSQTKTSRAGNWRWTFATLLMVGGAVGGIYGGAVDAPFIYDDLMSIVRNPGITRLWPLTGDAQDPGPLTAQYNRPTAARPLVSMTLAINYHFGQLDPVGYHLFNMAVHVLSAALLAAVVRRTLYLDYFGGRFDRAAAPLSLCVALLWAVHPLQTETVIYTTQRTELLMAFWYLATLYASLRYWTTERCRGLWLVLATLACLAGMASKQVMVTAPLVVLLYQRTFLTGSFRESLIQSGRLYAGLALGWVVLLWLNFDDPTGRAGGFDTGIAPYAWWFTQTKVLWLYLKLAVWPWPLSIYYGVPYLTSVGEAWPWVVPTVLLAIGTVYLLARRSAAGFLAASAGLVLLPTALVPIVTEVAAERRMYLPLAALVTWTVVGGYAVLQRRQAATGRRWVLIGAGIFAAAILGLSLVSVGRLNAYESELALWQDAQLHQPDDLTVATGVGYFLNQAGRPADAARQYEHVLELKPDSAMAHNGLAVALLQLGKPQEAAEHFHQAIQLAPRFPEVHYRRAEALLQAGQREEAVAAAEKALELARSQAKIALVRELETWLSAHRADSTKLPDTSPPASQPTP